MKFSSIILVALMILSCSSSQTSTNNKENSSNQQVKIITPKIIFINYNVYKSTNSKVKADFINKIIVEGSLKNKNYKNDFINNEHFLCVQQNNRSKAIDTITINNPLIKDIEYVDASGSLDKKRVKLDSTEMSLRLQLTPYTKFISIIHKNTTISKIEL